MSEATKSETESAIKKTISSQKPTTLLEKVTNTTFVKHADGSVLVCVSQDSAKTKGKQISFLGAPEKTRDLYEAKFEFKPSNHDEMQLKLGDIIAVTDQMDDGWYRGKNVQTKQAGVFPGNYVQKVELDIEKTKEEK